MDKKIIILFLLGAAILTSCKENCQDLPSSFENYQQAKALVLSANYKHSYKADTSDSPWITSAKYLSCNNVSGFFVMKIRNKTYIYQNMPHPVWENFTKSDSKGRFYNKKIKGRYQLKLTKRK
ncbi:KTSC domain-containing protein [Lutibacter sp. A80]|uniref:KTSC domain-containing protein n=1 Tax=Lutibacter sp. A80 TaxID=2918453 RepID=UPI001F070848|nr:KTSC domain-containing protein [Lutibacter sp. A80]UMB59222.1 KTSC domain-containing protein [Lutibacter sp. A80]